MTRYYRVPCIGTGHSIREAFRPKYFESDVQGEHRDADGELRTRHVDGRWELMDDSDSTRGWLVVAADLPPVDHDRLVALLDVTVVRG